MMKYLGVQGLVDFSCSVIPQDPFRLAQYHVLPLYI